mgnify:FL=1|tara:strand:+ start:1578 stop:2396 length:819 start_codon:yes stop_codon:yes gene_type:complete
MIYWFTGQPGAGKTTLAKALINRMDPFKGGATKTIHVDGDGLRDLFKNYDYSPEGRVKNIQSVLDLCRFLDSKGLTVIVSVVAPYKEMRDSLKETNDVTEIYVHTTETRGREDYFAKDYEPPTENFIDMDTTDISIEECLDKIPMEIKEVDELDKRNTIAIDFDGVIHEYGEGFKGLENAYDIPKIGVYGALKQFKDDGFIVKIMSSRPAHVIEKWLESYNLSQYIDGVTNQKIPATVYIDDRGFLFKNWDQCMEEIYKHPKLRKASYATQG